MAFVGPEACGRSTRGRLPGSSYLDLPPKCSQYGILWLTSAYGRYHNLRDVARQAFDAPRALDSCSVMRRGGTGLMRCDRVAGLSGW